MKSLAESLGGIKDPSAVNGLEHKLMDIMIIAILAVICGADGWTNIEDFGRCKKEWLETFLELPNGILFLPHEVVQVQFLI